MALSSVEYPTGYCRISDMAAVGFWAQILLFPHKVSLGYDYQYPIKRIGEASYNIYSRIPIKMKEVLYGLGLQKNLLSISTLDKK